MISLNIFLKLTPIIYISLPLLSSKTIQLSRDIQKGVGGKEKRIDKSQTERKNEWVSRKEGEKERKREREGMARTAREWWRVPRVAAMWVNREATARGPEGRRESARTAERQSRCAHLGHRRTGACAIPSLGRSPLTKLLTFRHPVAS